MSGLVLAGELSLATLIPGAFSLFAQLDVNIQAQLTAAIGVQANLSLVPPSIKLMADLAGSIAAKLAADVALGLSPPDLSVSVNAQVSLLLQLQASLTAMIALGSAGAEVYTWSGPLGQFGPALTTALGAIPGATPTDASWGLVLETRVPAAVVQLETFFAGAFP